MSVHLRGTGPVQHNLSEEHSCFLFTKCCLSLLSSFVLLFFLHFFHHPISMTPVCSPPCLLITPGPMVWYQKFEYAVGHWLQKTAEHVFGSVLCSPGCFSLFRGSALMDDNVLKRYTTTATRAAEYVQYDQGWHTHAHAPAILTSPRFVSLTVFFDCPHQFYASLFYHVCAFILF